MLLRGYMIWDIVAIIVGLRNVLFHEHLKMDKRIIYSVLRNNLVDIKKFIISINDNFI